MPASKTCGPHTELVTNDVARITRCTCGTVHVTLVASGVTVRMSSEQLKGIGAAMKAAVERLDAAPSHLGTTSIN
jgi:hypothetical protein